MGVNSLPKTVTRQRRGCDLNQGHSAPESSTLTTRLPSHPRAEVVSVKAGLQEERVVVDGRPRVALGLGGLFALAACQTRTDHVHLDVRSK